MSATYAFPYEPVIHVRGAGRAGMLAGQLLKSIRDRAAPEGAEPWELLEEVLGIVAAAEKRIIEQRARIEALESLVMTDPLTGLENRRWFESQLTRVLAAAARHNDTGVLMYIDLDDFKSVNDTYGHDAGDAVLRRVADVLRANTRKSDVLSRLGGDEFAVLLTHTGTAEGQYRARRMGSLLGHAYAEYQGQHLPLRASIGTAAYGQDTKFVDLVRRADAEMYREKRTKADAEAAA
jgi:diguanylate cyclase (GGDEF)-like protein